ncbi:RNA exonuclease 4 [Gadus chalcogrammus]|uniref:RNA exonuclease 4 n=1 Tax=Gadus chalcogrammus TaxID=1042646 RepID=UPI0024C4E435|nr:RNA exonuclease 4 [Gadus chalcogrammus]
MKVVFRDNSAKAATAKTPGTAAPAPKKKMKIFFKDTRRKKQGGPQPVNAPLAPPSDPKQFSANWKALLEIMKANPEPKAQKSDVPKKPSPKEVNGTTKPLPASSLTNGGKAAKSKTLSSKETVTPAEERNKPTKKRKGTGGKDEKKPAKRKESGGKDDQQPAKKKAKEGRDDQQPAKKKYKGGKDGHQSDKKEKGAQEPRPPTDADLWFDDVDPDDIEEAVGKEAADVVRRRTVQKKAPQHAEDGLVKSHAFTGLTRAVAIDCEMVGVGPDGEHSILARVSIVNHFGKMIYDRYVKPTEEVTDYRTAFSGIRPEDIKDGEDMKTVQKEVGEIMEGRILVGHAIHNDLKVLFLDHPKKKIRDTQKYKPFRVRVKSSRPSLKVLSREVLNVKVQQGEHSSVQDAQATMRLYTMVKKNWEAEIKATRADKAEARKPRPSALKPHPFKDK